MKRRKQLIKDYKMSPRPKGIFQILNLENDKRLIGSSNDLEGILNRHRFELKAHSHPNKALQAEWNKFGETSFLFEVVEELQERSEPDSDHGRELECLEDLWIEKYKPFGEFGYNVRKMTRGERLAMIASKNRNRAK